ncbi:MAG TPA: serine/threonine-protein kinase [Blastocatellia bacterium]|nr:serine/threonine-protein kinase [Blastocatellia bacterium]
MKFCPACQKNYESGIRYCSQDGAQLSFKDPYQLVGRTLADRYRIDALVGVGGMGAVYSARHTGIDRRVAFKILLPHLALNNERVLQLFEQEARIAGSISHENIVDIKDAGRTPDGLAYIVMEWLDGHTLDEELSRQGPLSLDRTAFILEQMTAALHAAHTQNIIHRDLKPANVMIARRLNGSEQVKVLDFGIGKILGDTAGSLVSSVMGTPHYASPEQLQQGGLIDKRADIYSLGVMLFQMLTNELPFNSTSIHEVMRMHLTTQPPSLLSVRSEIPASVDGLVRRMLAKDPAGRPQNAMAVSNLFRAAIHGHNYMIASVIPDGILLDEEGEVVRPATHAKSRHILWVDDYPENNAGLVAQLREEGMIVVEVLSTKQAMQMLASTEKSFDLLISDMGRKEDGEKYPTAGLSLIKAVREAGFSQPLYIYTSAPQVSKRREEVLNAGGNGITCSVDELFEWIAATMSSGQRQEVSGQHPPA